MTEKEKYTFNMKPEDYQPSGCCDFSKIYNSKEAILIYTDLNSKKKEHHVVKRTEIINENGIKEFIYIFPAHFIEKKS